eukprot:SAG31_NODE_6133_length_2156_cov_1.166262_2_plen_75_part_00
MTTTLCSTTRAGLKIGVDRISDRDLQRLFKGVDADRSGRIDAQEFSSFLDHSLRGTSGAMDQHLDISLIGVSRR